MCILQVSSSDEIILFEGSSPAQYADKIWKSLTSGAILCPLDGLVSKAELDKIEPLYRKQVIELASPWLSGQGVANPYTMLWVAAYKGS